jgi:hypothetical protein
VGDMLWHTLFGIEKDVEALFSPTHIMLACGAWLMVGGPFHAAWQRLTPPERRWHQHLPWLLSLTWMLSTGTFRRRLPIPSSISGGGEFSGARLDVAGPGRGRHAVGYWLPDGVFLLTMRRWALPGALTLVMVSTRWPWAFCIMAPIHSSPWWHGPWRLWGPRWCTSGCSRLCSAPVPGGSLPSLSPSCSRRCTLRRWVTVGVWWSVHLWAGTIVLTSLVGLLVSMLLYPHPGQARHRTAPELVCRPTGWSQGRRT